MEKKDQRSEELSEWQNIDQSNDNNLVQTEDSTFHPNELLDDDRNDRVERAESEVKKLKRLYFGVLDLDFFRGIRKFDWFKVGFWSVFGVAVVVVVSLLHRRVKKWWKSMKMEHKEYLLLLIKEKDKKIKQLMLRIAQLNEILRARRKVPILRVN